MANNLAKAPCPTCRGSGTIVIDVKHVGFVDGETVTEIQERRCTECKGTGLTSEYHDMRGVGGGLNVVCEVVKCKHCGGKGIASTPESRMCQECLGYGTADPSGAPCVACKGTSSI